MALVVVFLATASLGAVAVLLAWALSGALRRKH